MKVNRIVRSMAAMVLVAAGVGASSTIPAAADPPPQYFLDKADLPFEGVSGLPPTNRYWGVQGGGPACEHVVLPDTVKECAAGAGYRIEVPQNWNGRLVMWAHGFAGTGLELSVQNHPLRSFLIASGYAWAASSYSRNDYDVEAGVQDTHALVQLFKDIVGEPSRVYMTGASMGGHITAAAIEQYRNEYDGAMPICGVLGDHELFDYFLDFNLVAAALAGVPTSFPPDPVVWAQSVPQIKSTLAGSWPSGLTPDGQHLKDLTEVRSGGERPLFDEAWTFWDDFLFQFGDLDGTVPRSPGIVVDNTDAVYQFDNDPALSPAEKALNDSVLRVAQTPAGRVEHGMTNVPVVNGTPSIPVLTLHDIGDFFVPFSMEQIYAMRVAAAGRSDLLVQRAIRGVDHCDFSGAELVRGFVDLVNWVEHGVRPPGDDITTPDVVADPNYGCKFTTPERPSLPSCRRP